MYLPTIFASKAGNKHLIAYVACIFILTKHVPETLNIQLNFKQKKRERILMPIELGRKIARKNQTRNYSCIYISEKPYIEVFVEKKGYLPLKKIPKREIKVGRFTT